MLVATEKNSKRGTVPNGKENSSLVAANQQSIKIHLNLQKDHDVGINYVNHSYKSTTTTCFRCF